MTNTNHLRELIERATKGPWRVGCQYGAPAPHLIDMGSPPSAPFLMLHNGSTSDDCRPINNYAVAHTDGPIDERDASVRLIVALVNQAPAMLDELDALREALKPFADCCEQIADDESDEEWAKFRLLVKDYRRARAALKQGNPT